MFRLLREELGGDCPLAKIDRPACRKLQKLIRRLPPNATKKFPNLTAAEAADEAGRQHLSLIRPSTVNGYLATVSSLFRWAVDEGHMPSNPARRLLVPKDNEAIRDPFSIEQLQRIFTAPIFSGCEDDQRNFAKPGPNHPRRARFWVPLLGLFHGLRLNEICQLGVDDIQKIDGIPVIMVREARPDQSVKSRSGIRNVPIHPTVQDIGFFDYVTDIKSNGHERLFPELTRDGRGYFSDRYQKFFARFLIKCGAAKPRTTFHSFRHSWNDALRSAGVPKEIRQTLGGWKQSGADAGYGSGEPLGKLSEAIAKVDYPGLDLSHLALGGAKTQSR